MRHTSIIGTHFMIDTFSAVVLTTSIGAYVAIVIGIGGQRGNFYRHTTLNGSFLSVSYTYAHCPGSTVFTNAV